MTVLELLRLVSENLDESTRLRVYTEENREYEMLDSKTFSSIVMECANLEQGKANKDEYLVVSKLYYNSLEADAEDLNMSYSVYIYNKEEDSNYSLTGRDWRDLLAMDILPACLLTIPLNDIAWTIVDELSMFGTTYKEAMKNQQILYDELETTRQEIEDGTAKLYSWENLKTEVFKDFSDIVVTCPNNKNSLSSWHEELMSVEEALVLLPNSRKLQNRRDFCKNFLAEYSKDPPCI